MYIFAFYTPEGFLRKTAEKAEIFRKFIPGKQPLEQTSDLVVSEELDTDFKKFCNILEQNKEPEKCLITYPTFSSLREFKIRITEDENGFYAQLLNKQEQLVDYCLIKDIKPCVIAGKNKAAENFYSNYLKERSNLMLI